MGIERVDPELLLAYVEDELDAASRAALEAKLGEDVALRGLVEQLREDRLLLRSLPQPSTPYDFVEVAQQRLERLMLLGERPLPAASRAVAVGDPVSMRISRVLAIGAAAAMVMMGVAIAIYLIHDTQRLGRQAGTSRQRQLSYQALAQGPTSTPPSQPKPADPVSVVATDPSLVALIEPPSEPKPRKVQPGPAVALAPVAFEPLSRVGVNVPATGEAGGGVDLRVDVPGPASALRDRVLEWSAMRSWPVRVAGQWWPMTAQTLGATRARLLLTDAPARAERGALSLTLEVPLFQLPGLLGDLERLAAEGITLRQTYRVAGAPPHDPSSWVVTLRFLTSE